MTWQMAIWLVLVVAVSAGLLLGVVALTDRIQAIDERLSELRLLGLELTRTFKSAVSNQTSELNAIKLRLDQLSTQQSDFLQGGAPAHRLEPPKMEGIAEITAPEGTEHIAIPQSDER